MPTKPTPSAALDSLVQMAEENGLTEFGAERLAEAKGILAAVIAERDCLAGECGRLRAALEESIGTLCMMVGDMRDRGLYLSEAVLQGVLDRNRAALTTTQGTQE